MERTRRRQNLKVELGCNRGNSKLSQWRKFVAAVARWQINMLGWEGEFSLSSVKLRWMKRGGGRGGRESRQHGLPNVHLGLIYAAA